MKDAGVMYAVWFTQILRIWSCTIPKAKISISGAQYKAAEPSAAVYFCSINLHGLLTGMYTATQVQYMYVSVSPAALSGSSSSGKVSGCMHTCRSATVHEIRIFSVEDRMFESMKVDVFSVKIEYFILNLE
jgi:hypothetical protein